MTNYVQNTPKLTSIAIVAYCGAQMSAVLGLEDLLAIANRFVAQKGQDEVRVFRIDDSYVRHDADDIFAAIILPPNLTGSRGESDRLITDFIRRQHAQGCTICSACAGVFWLGEAGLIDGRPVTTHWALENEFLERFPGSKLKAKQILIDDTDIVTAGGMMAWVDLGLFLVERYLGSVALTYTARQLLVDPRGRQQSNYRTFRPQLTHGDQTIERLQNWMDDNLGEDLSVAALAKHAVLSERTFIRRFKSATGLPPNRYVQALRVENARTLLERTRRTVQDICWTVGYRDVSAFGRVFKSVTDLSPADYRNRFGGAMQQFG